MVAFEIIYNVLERLLGQNRKHKNRNSFKAGGRSSQNQNVLGKIMKKLFFKKKIDFIIFRQNKYFWLFKKNPISIFFSKLQRFFDYGVKINADSEFFVYFLISIH